MKLIALLLALLFAPMTDVFGAETPLAPGVKVTIRLLVPAMDATNVTGEYVVSDSGVIKVPYIQQDIPAAGVTASDLARRVEKAWVAAEIYTAPRVQILRMGDTQNLEQSVYVSGEIKTGGAEVPYKEGLRLLQAITKGGGFTEFADTEKIKIIRGGRQLGPFNMSKISPDGSNNPVLQPDDQIIVPQD